MEFETSILFYDVDIIRETQEMRLKQEESHSLRSNVKISVLSEDEGKDYQEFVSNVVDWIFDMESNIQLKPQYGYWVCQQDSIETYLVLNIPESECTIQNKRSPLLNDLSLFHTILEKLQDNQKIKTKFDYDTYKKISSSWCSLFECLFNEESSPVRYENYRLEVRIKRVETYFF